MNFFEFQTTDVLTIRRFLTNRLAYQIERRISRGYSITKLANCKRDLCATEVWLRNDDAK